MSSPDQARPAAVGSASPRRPATEGSAASRKSLPTSGHPSSEDIEDPVERLADWVPVPLPHLTPEAWRHVDEVDRRVEAVRQAREISTRLTVILLLRE